VGDLELLPGDDAASTHLVRLYFESTVLEAEHMGFLGEDARQQAHDGPTQEAAVSCCVAPVEKRILFLAVAVEVTVNPNLPPLCFRDLFEQALCVEDFGVELLIRVDPLSVEVDAGRRVSIITADDAIRIQTRDKDKSVVAS